MFYLLFAFLSLNPGQDKVLGEMTGRNFFDLLSNKDWEKATLLTSDQVNFDGQLIKTTKKIEKKMQEIIENHKPELDFTQYFFLSGVESIEKFGELPPRLSSVNIKKAIVGLARRSKGGVVIFLEKPKDTGYWRITGIHD
jgi:hypothetical protein